MSSSAPTRVKMRSTSPIRALRAGTKLPSCAKRVIKATWRRYVDLPAMFGPVGSNKAFCVDQRLLAQVVRWNELEMAIAHLDIVAKDLVKANFERLDAGAFAFAALQRDHPALRVMDRFDEFVEFGMETKANQPL